VAATIDLAAADRGVALRAANDETILREWMRQGAELVARGAPAERGPALAAAHRE
jgi:hypothetical protein